MKPRKFEEKLEKYRKQCFQEQNFDEMKDKREEQELEKVDDELRKKKIETKKKELKTIKDQERAEKNGTAL